MKKIIFKNQQLKTLTLLIAVSLMIPLKTNAQITLEHTLDSTWATKFYCTDIGNNDFKYVMLDASSNSFSLYNMDMSPYMTNIVIPSATDSIAQGFTVVYITKALFDCDTTNIEYAYDWQYDVTKPFRVFRTDGTLLLQVDSANGPYCGGCFGGTFYYTPIINTSDGTKLFIQKYDINQIPEMLIYALCGILPNNVFDFSNDKFYVKVFPNPTSMELNFEVSLPNNQEEFQIMIFDATAKENKKESISIKQGKCSINVRNYDGGTYFYSLVSTTKVYQTGKFSLIK